MEKVIDWIIHYCNNDKCECCGKTEVKFLPNMCNAHTHGMEKYFHMDFQVVLNMDVKIIADILNMLGRRVQNGEHFQDGDYVMGIFTDCKIYLKKYEETDREVLRVIIPDNNNVFPRENSYMSPYDLQLLETDRLLIHQESIS